MKPNISVRAVASLGRRQRGLTLIELMVALVLGLMVTLAAVAALLIGRQGFTSVDSSTALRENARFAQDIMQRVIIQAGFEDVAGGHSARLPSDPKDPGLFGYDNAYIGPTAGAITGSPPTGVATDDRTTKCTQTDTSCASGSDVLMVRYWGTSVSPGSATADGAMINCMGIPEPEGTEPAYSIFHVVREATGEPALACTYRDSAGVYQTQSLVRGVESMQVLYGTDNVTANAAPPASSAGQDGVPDNYLTARQLTVAGNATATTNNWRRVRSVRIGLVFRGDVGSAVDRSSSGGNIDVLQTLITTPSDIGSLLAAPNDGRLRQNLILTVHLRNQQGYDVYLP